MAYPIVFNVSKGRVAELHNRVDANDPTNAVLIVAAFNSTAADTVMQDLDTFAAIESDGNTAEVTNGNYARKVLTDTDVAATVADDTNDRMPADIADQVWTAVAAGDAWTHLVIGYLADSTGGTGAANNANIVPLTMHEFAVTPNGGDITAQVNDYYRAS